MDYSERRCRFLGTSNVAYDRRCSNKLPRSVHYWADLAIFSRFYWQVGWVPTTPSGCLKWDTLDGPGERLRAGAIFILSQDLSPDAGLMNR